MVRYIASGFVLVAVAVPVCYCQKYSYFLPSSPSLYIYNHLMTLSRPIPVAISHFSYYN